MRITVIVSCFNSMAFVLAYTPIQRISQAVFKGTQLEVEISCSSTAEV